jgi:hypothetical protein
LPKLFEIGRYIIFFWSNEVGEPIHIHIAEHNPSANATKVWLTRNGGFVVAHNKSKIPQHKLNQILDLVSTEYFRICSEWKRYFNADDIKFYC